MSGRSDVLRTISTSFAVAGPALSTRTFNTARKALYTSCAATPFKRAGGQTRGEIVAARATAAARLRTPSLLYRLCTWYWTVLPLMNKRRPISR
jgi:hypothetical protein